MNFRRFLVFLRRAPRHLHAHALFLGLLMLGGSMLTAHSAEQGAASREVDRLASGTLAASDPKAARVRLVELRREIARHDVLYFQKAAPEISDSAYDQLKRELLALENTFSELAARLPRNEALGDDRSGLFPVIRHRERMRSLEKSYTEGDLRSFYARLVKQLGRDDLRFVIEPKFDGLSISVTYENGRLVRAVTRGNGMEGDDVTANVLTIATLPRVLHSPTTVGGASTIPAVVELRGEVYLPFAEFARINREREANGEPTFAHPRNVAAGTLKQLDPEAVSQRRLAIVFYGWGAWEPALSRPSTQSELHERIRAWGLPGLDQWRTAASAKEIWSAVQALAKERAALPYPIDGAVVKLDSVRDWETVGVTEHAPQWATAYKFLAERAETRLLAITIQVGRTGLLTPVAELEPVRLGGTTIARASLHNRAEIARTDFRIGDLVTVEKAGEIIPALVAVNTARRSPESRPFVFPSHCPSCGSKVVVVEGEIALRCNHSACPAQLQRRLQHFASDAGMNIAGFGPALIEKLVNAGRLKTLSDIYRLRPEDLMEASASSLKTADRLMSAIEKSKDAELWRLISGLGIPEVGAVTSRALAHEFQHLEVLMETDAEDLAARKVGARAAAAVVTYFAEPKNRLMLAELVRLGVRPGPSATLDDVVPRRKSSAHGLIFVFSGTLPSLTRAEATEKILAAGGKISGEVTERTSYVVVGKGGGAKMETARELGIMAIDEAALLALLGKD